MVKHLPPAVKQLLNLRNPRSRPSPPLAKLNAIFSSTYNDAKEKRVEKGWLTLTTCTLLTANVPSSVGYLYRFATRDDPDNAHSRRSLAEAVDKAALIRESALKSCIFVGVPRTILSLAGLHEALETDVTKGLRKESKRTATPENVDEITARGRALWASIYEPHAEKLHNKLGSYHPDFIAACARAIHSLGFARGSGAWISSPFTTYGSVLAPLPGGESEQGNLSRALGSVVGSACLRAEGGVGPQLVSHVFGLLKARYERDLSEEDRWLSSDEGTEWVIRTVDSILDVVKPEEGPMAQAKL
ncbi:Dol-P-Man:Man(5)GlcNAc(2)-PP-Dol alpha-1,3-mannosyltransferase [Grifola frondosa]|uniref:Dol-P-Man:Man(5)GlcNAc(2)-PP-Dol alpha-1,3-mannosyltransferase n=1 Tax=Grifola frondosa TaxID=5627 RepID=A0A1C7MHY9_GRIFR|nr:Dol-P-Man:Man(5)GlcNAc(2)-PP-Dol alpha-1,3-mannosyltransferase [Grifola frondosa]